MISIAQCVYKRYQKINTEQSLTPYINQFLIIAYLYTSINTVLQVYNYVDTILIYIGLWIDCLFEIRKIAVCFLWLSLPGHYRVTDEALLAETT